MYNDKGILFLFKLIPINGASEAHCVLCVPLVLIHNLNIFQTFLAVIDNHLLISLYVRKVSKTFSYVIIIIEALSHPFRSKGFFLYLYSCFHIFNFLQTKWYYYLMLAIVDVEGNFLGE